ncbi:MAG: hypothetical protein JNM39_05335 [Bdellovibrionaceae bacterium]|nr:hypothetical protein [Pseudobdellovibrionaceae bacterium]
MRKIRFIGLILIVGAGIFLTNTLKEQWTLIPKDSLTPNESQFFQDFDSLISKLKKDKNLPAQFMSIQYVKYRFHSKLAVEHLGNHHLPIKTSPTGKNVLEADFISRPDSPNDHFILQLGLVEIESGNKIWENSENFKLPITKATK